MTKLVLEHRQEAIDRQRVLGHWFVKQTPEENDTRLDWGPMDETRIRDELKIIQRSLLFLLNNSKTEL